jgi:tRNA1(Val) A37 N6-methylase TrmN6
MHTGGIVRPPRRPPGWTPPGPRPAGFACDGAPRPRSGEDLCYLAGDWRIFQRLGGHRWSLDDLVTAWVAAQTLQSAPPSRLLDLGCGIGSVLLLLAWRFPTARCLGVEAEADRVDLARRSIAWNGVGRRCHVVRGDFRDATDRDGVNGPFDLVTGTPPYLPPGTATPPNRPHCRPCRLEERGGIEAYCERAAGLLGSAGRFIVCMAAAREARTHAAARRADLRVLHTLDVIPRAGKPALFSVYVMGRSGGASSGGVPSALVVRDRRGERTDAFRRLRQQMGMPP